MTTIRFKKSEIYMHKIDGYIVDFNYEFSDKHEGFIKDICFEGIIKVSISRWLMEYWEFDYPKNENKLIEIAFPFAVDEARRKLSQNNNNSKTIEVNLSISNNGHFEYPYSLEKISYDKIIGYLVYNEL